MPFRPGEEWQRVIKAELILDSFSRMGVDAMTLGVNDFKFGLDFLLEQAAERRLPYVCANLLRSDNGAPLFPPHLVKEVDGLRIGIIGVAGSGIRADGVKVGGAREAVERSIAELQAKGIDFLILLSSAGASENEKLARDFDAIDVIVASGSRRSLDPPNHAGNAIIVEPGSRGKYLGVLRIDYSPGSRGWLKAAPGARERQNRARYEKRIQQYRERLKTARNDISRRQIERQIQFYQTRLEQSGGPTPSVGPGHRFVNSLEGLSRDVADDPEIQALVDAALTRLNQPPPAYVHEEADSRTGSHSAAEKKVFGDFVGVQVCAGCHLEEERQWKTTGHARAYAALTASSRQLDHECFSCHITGFGHPGGPSDPLDVGYLKNVQCEACHGSGRKHVSDPKRHRLAARVPEATCVRCHTEEQTQGRFVYKDYLPKIVHRRVEGGKTSP